MSSCSEVCPRSIAHRLIFGLCISGEKRIKGMIDAMTPLERSFPFLLTVPGTMSANRRARVSSHPRYRGFTASSGR